MPTRMLVCLSIILICFGKLAVAKETIWIRSLHSAQSGNVSIVVDLPPGTKAEPSQFHLLEDNKITATASSITPFSDSDWRFAIVFCIDKSGSISNTELEKAKDALKSLLRKPLFKKQDRLALVSFENEPRVIQWFTQPKEIYKKINELEYMKGMHTVLYDTLYDSLGHINSIDASSPLLKRILVITDGEDDGSLRQNIAEVRAKALETGVSIDVVLLHAKQKDVETMQALAGDTGGKFINTDANSLESQLQEMFKKILASYVVSFERSIDTALSKTDKVGVQFQGPDMKLISSSVQAGISQSAVVKTVPNVQPKLPPPDESTLPGIDEGATITDTNDETTGDRLWWFFLFLLLAGVVAFAIWRLRPKSPHVPVDKNDNKKPKPVPVPQPEHSHQTLRKKTLVGNSSSPQQTETWKTPAGSSTPSHHSARRKTLVGGPSFPGPQPDSSIAILVCLSGPLEGQQFAIEKESFHIGANLESDLCISQDEYVSGDHACLRYESGSLILFDQGSNNGTFVNDAPVTETGIILKPGEQIRIGTSVFEVGAPAGE